MTWIGETPFAGSGGGLFRLMYDALLANGWTLIEAEDERSTEWAAEPVAQETLVGNDEQDLVVTATFVPDTDVTLPAMMFADGAVILDDDDTTPLVEATDYDWVSKARGIIHTSTDVAWNTKTHITLKSGSYSFKGGWVVLSSNGVSTEKNYFAGLRLAVVGGAATPIKSGVRSCGLQTWSPGSQDWLDEFSGSIRSPIATDHYHMTDPNVAGFFMAAVDADRIVSHARSTSDSAVYIGGGEEFRETAIQSSCFGIVGTQGNLAGSSGLCPIGSTGFDASTANANIGTVWMYDRQQFAGAGVPVELNVNHLSGNWPEDYTPSLVDGYAHMIFTAAGRSIDELQSGDRAIYFPWKGLFMPCVANMRHGDVVTWKGDDYRLWRVHSAPDRFWAVKEA